MDKDIRFSLIIGTLDRASVLEVCLNKLREQTYKNFEIIVVDQSDNDETRDVINKFTDLDIRYIRSDIKGLSRARNIALSLMTCDYFCLVDDDADYREDYLEKASDILRKNPDVILSGFIKDTYLGSALVSYGEIRKKDDLSIREIIRLCPSAGLVIPATAVKKAGVFDEDFGVGARFGSTEESDFLLRCKRCGYKVIHTEDLYIEHPIVRSSEDIKPPMMPEKARLYSRGGGAFFKKHIKYMKEHDLIPLYIETYMKKLIKRIVANGDGCAKQQFAGFKEGYREYRQ